jgi:hypothetical protein
VCSTTVAGESAELLREALLQMEATPDRHGMTNVSFRLEPRLGDPFLRALMRVQAELMLRDADALMVLAARVASVFSESDRGQ